MFVEFDKIIPLRRAKTFSFYVLIKMVLYFQENIYTIPNFLCLSRIASAPLLVHLICQAENYPYALALFGVAGVTDAVSI